MQLHEWLAHKGISKTEFASRAGISNSYMTDLCRGRCYPGREIARAIARVTEGEVTANDFVGPDDEAA